LVILQVKKQKEPLKGGILGGKAHFKGVNAVPQRDFLGDILASMEKDVKLRAKLFQNHRTGG